MSKNKPTAPSLQMVALDQLDPNPWQTREQATPEQLQDLAADIATRGVLQPPTARPVNGRYQLAFGHRRATAAQAAGLKEIPINVREIDDPEMADLAAVENAQRKDLSAIETANALSRRIADFDLTQEKAGIPFGLTQSAVANLLRLRGLPPEIQALIHTGTLPERYARRLLPIAAKDPNSARDIAAQTAGSTDNEREGLFSDLTDKWYNNHLPRVSNADWPSSWIPGGYSSTACQDCTLADKHRWCTYCTDPTCYHKRESAWAEAQAAKAAKALKIPVARPDENPILLMDGKTGNAIAADIIRGWLKKPPADLRLVPTQSDSWLTCDVLGTAHTALATTDVNRAETFQAEKTKRQEQSKKDQEKSAEKANLEEAKRSEKEQEYEALMPQAAELIAKHLPTKPGLLAWFSDIAHLDPAQHKNLRQDLALRWLEQEQEHFWQDADIRKALANAGKKLGFTVPKGWPNPPATKKPAPKKAATKKMKK